MLKGKKVLIGVTGGIAAYKIPFLIRLLIKEEAFVKVVMTQEACNFVTPLTLSTLSQNPVSILPFSPSDGNWHSHIELGSWADLYLIAPLTANTLAKMATGISDNLLLATYLAARCPIFFAPSMDVDMYHHPSTQQNIATLQSHGNILISPQAGALASGLTGMGRLEEPQKIVEILRNHFSKQLPLTGKQVLISSGPTIERIDPVRYISNYSTGQMGNALAEEAASRGADVYLISGPVNKLPVHPKIQITRVNTASEMHAGCKFLFGRADITIMAAAVADYTPVVSKSSKIKKRENKLSLDLVKTKDILDDLGKVKRPNQVLVGFALETDNEIENAISKLHTKNLDLIVLNSLQDIGAGFGHETNKIRIINRRDDITEFELKSKKEVATDIFDFIQKEIIT